MTKINLIKKLKGPIGIFGAGGFIGINLLKTILKTRSDVIGFSQNPTGSWRIKANQIPTANLNYCNLLDENQTQTVIRKYQPKTIFNLSAYGAYSKQTDIKKIYLTNFHAVVNLVETLKQHSFAIYIQAGSQSEYGLNATAPGENDELVPNSHYAISKTALFYLIQYYGRVEKLPTAHLRFYSAYGPWEEPDRLIPTLIAQARRQKLPRLVDPDISRDFVYIDDAVNALIQTGVNLKKEHYGEAFNIATGRKTTIRELAQISQKLFHIKQKPTFGTMVNRRWDLTNWVGNPDKIKNIIGWEAKTSLEEGLIKTYQHYEKNG